MESLAFLAFWILIALAAVAAVVITVAAMRLGAIVDRMREERDEDDDR